MRILLGWMIKTAMQPGGGTQHALEISAPALRATPQNYARLASGGSLIQRYGHSRLGVGVPTEAGEADSPRGQQVFRGVPTAAEDLGPMPLQELHLGPQDLSRAGLRTLQPHTCARREATTLVFPLAPPRCTCR